MHMRARRRALVAVPATIVLLLGITLPTAALDRTARGLSATELTPSSRVTGFKSASGGLAQSDRSLLARNDSARVPVVIKLDYDAVASYAGTIPGLRATSPVVTGRELTGRTAAERAYTSYIERQEAAAIERISRMGGVTIGLRLRTVYGGFAAVIPARLAKRIAALPGVVAVQKDNLNQPLTDSSPEFIRATAVYSALGTTANAGEGVILANLDTGLWPEHEAFADQGNLSAPPPRPDGTARTCEYGDNPLTPADDPFECQNKLIGGEAFLDTYHAIEGDEGYPGTARDDDGHGTHTASTSAGNIVDHATVFGVDRGTVHGIAPGAHVIEYRVCGPGGCFDSDSAAAVQEAIYDGADALNFSISGGTQPFSDPVELAFLDAYAAGVFVAASAGNDGPGASTTNHLSPWVTTVAASTQTREFATTLSLTADNSDTFEVDGASITAGAGPAPVVLAADVPGYSDPLCGELPPEADTFDGLIVVCQRGTQARVWKSFVVSEGGGEGVVLYNPSLADVETDNHWLPTIHVADGTDLVAFMESHTGITGSFPAGEARDGQGDVMAAFSSRGPAGLVIKPDVTAPGVQILAGNTPTPPAPTAENGAGPEGEYYQAIAGTSMSSPHVAGAALLLAAAHPNWTPGQIKSALMTAAITDVLKEDIATPADPFDMGAGRIQLGRSNRVALAIDESAHDFLSMGNDPLAAVHLNLPSVNAPVLPGRLVTTREVVNISGVTQTFSAWAVSPAGSTITVSPSSFRLRPGQPQTLTIDISTKAPMGEQQFGSIQLRAQAGTAQHLPVAFIRTQADVSLSQHCNPDSISQGDTSRCVVTATNHSFDEQTVDLDTFLNRKLRLVRVVGAERGSSSHAFLHDVALAGGQPGTPSLETYGPLGSGYLALSGFGVDPDPIGDEEFINYDVPPFVYNGKTYGTIGVNSNGYLVAGGGTAEDNNCCNVPGGPSPERPNDVLAPFWTDLDGSDAPGIYAAILTDGAGSFWLIIESHLDVWGTTDERILQVWIGLNGVQDITFNYGNAQPDPNGQDFLVGAENEIGEGEMNAALPTEDFVVVSTDPIPGDSATYRVVVRGSGVGTGRVRTTMTGPGLPGTTIVRTSIAIGP